MSEDHRPSNWSAALEVRQLELLRFIIQIVASHEQQTGRIITPLQLKAALEQGWP